MGHGSHPFLRWCKVALRGNAHLCRTQQFFSPEITAPQVLNDGARLAQLLRQRIKSGVRRGGDRDAAEVVCPGNAQVPEFAGWW